MIARLFVLAHDACHQSLTSNRTLNQILGRFAFLPSLTPYSTWELAHNSVHHVFSNWSKKDYVWAPFSKGEFDKLPMGRQLLERFYRNAAGLGLYYAVETWWKRLFFPKNKYVPVRRRYVWDSLATSIFLVAQLWLLYWAARPSALGILLQEMVMAVLPFVIWNHLMGFTIYLQHTHPHVPWFLKEDDWRRNDTQLIGTVHVDFPFPCDTLFHNIYKHTAHHLDICIPHYHLATAQDVVESNFPDKVTIEPFTFHRFIGITRACKLYDYETHCWLNFAGQVTARTRLALCERPRNGADGSDDLGAWSMSIRASELH
jgi:omega-6 fatty acid desaturase (delta-12 desaturase)